MAKIYTTEITSEIIPSDNPIHQRLFKAYVASLPYIHGDVLEIGCGEGRGVEMMLQQASTFTAVDKIGSALETLRKRFANGRFIQMDLPPLHGLSDNAYDCVVSFQVIEHIRDDRFFLQEIHRVLKPDGVALITTPNRKMSISRNPWHIREYLPEELRELAATIFRDVQLKGIAGNNKVMNYYEENRKSVHHIMRWDIFDLQHKLPSWVLRIPYELLNRLNRNRLQKANTAQVSGIHHDDYLVADSPDHALDLFLIVRK